MPGKPAANAHAATASAMKQSDGLFCCAHDTRVMYRDHGTDAFPRPAERRLASAAPRPSHRPQPELQGPTFSGASARGSSGARGSVPVRGQFRCGVSSGVRVGSVPVCGVSSGVRGQFRCARVSSGVGASVGGACGAATRSTAPPRRIPPPGARTAPQAQAVPIQTPARPPWPMTDQCPSARTSTGSAGSASAMAATRS